MLHPSALIPLVLCVALAAQQGSKPTIQGITISTHGIGRDWGSDRIVPCIEDIKAVGANWVAVHPYARIHRSGRVTWDSWDPERPPAELVRPIREAHKLGLKIFIKPHLAYWGSPFKWRGDITFDKDVEWQRFFASYREWIVAVAMACSAADGFCVGTELDKTIQKLAEWRAIIGAIRRATKSPLTYAANWTDYSRVGFWKELDIIGIQAYFPLTDKQGAGRAELEGGWSRTMTTLRRFADETGKNIVFTELGYNTAFEAPIRPWDAKSDGAAASGIQELCTAVALRAVAAEPRVEGAFLWKWFPPPSPVGRDFPLATEGMKMTIRQAWATAAKKPVKR